MKLTVNPSRINCESESRGFSPWVFSTGVLTGWVGLTLTGPSIVAVLRDGEQ